MGMSKPSQLNRTARSRGRRGSLTFAVLAGVVGFAATCPAAAASDGPKSDESFEPSTPAEKRAFRLDTDAMGPDFRAHRFTAGEKKIRDAIQVCMIQTCATSFKARLHRDLGFIYVAGMKHVEDGKDEFTAALAMDASVTLSPDMQAEAGVRQAFDEVKAEMNGSSPAPDSKAAEPDGAKKDAKIEEHAEPAQNKAESKSQSEPDKPADAKTSDESFPPPAENTKKSFLNWFSIGIEQDLVYHQQSNFACSTNSRYRCFDRQHRAFTVDEFAPGGNRVVSGLGLGTWRLLLGYDRVFAKRFSVGVRFGSVIYGKADILKGDRPFLYFHGEARIAAWLRRAAFEESGLRPYVFLSGGAAEDDGKVVVQVSWDRCVNCKLNAWKRSGSGFIGGGAGLQWAITPQTGPVLEARYLQFFQPALPAIGVQLGYAVGF